MAILTLSFFSVLANADEAPRFSCHGNEPFWGLYLNDSQITLKDAFSGDGITRKEHRVVGYTTPLDQVAGHIFVYQTETQESEPITIVIEKQSCSDYMSDSLYPYSTLYISKNFVLRGCCVKNN